MDSLATINPSETIGLLQEPKGIFIADTVIRHALLIGLDDLRKSPWQLPIIFASFLDDPYTSATYGVKEVNNAINWFLSTNIPVQWDVNLPSSPKLPFVSIGMNESNEAEATIGDVHYLPNEAAPATWEPVTPKFNAQYDPDTGLVTPSIDVIVNTQMLFLDGAGNKYPVLKTDDIDDKAVFYIQTGLNTKFSNCMLQWATSKLSVQLESLNFKESYSIGSHVEGEGYYLLYLDAIVLYCLLRYKKTLLEGRGFERTTIARSKVMKNILGMPEGTQNTWSRFITLTGFCKQYWAVQPAERITTATFDTAADDGLKLSQIGSIATTFKADQEDPPWLAADGVGVRLNG